VNDEPWRRYVAALGEISTAHAESTDLAGTRSRVRGEQLALLEDRGQYLAAQQTALNTLGVRLRAAANPSSLAQPAVPELDWAEAMADLDRYLATADRAAEEAEFAGRRPQLLPQWSGTRARNAAVYAVLCLPNAAFSALVSLLGSEASSRRFLWFLIVFPVLVVAGGAITIGRLAAPRIIDADPRTPTVPSADRKRRSVLVGLLIAWASWIVPGQTFELLHQLMNG
jgi:hypothetical protein